MTAILFAVSCSVAAQSQEALRLAFHELEQFSRESSPVYRQLQGSLQLQRNERAIDLQFRNPSLEIAQEYVAGPQVSERESFLLVEKRFEWPWIYSQRRQSWVYRVEALENRFTEEFASLIADVKTGYAALSLFETQILSVRETGDLLIRIERIGRAQQNEGSISGAEYALLRLTTLQTSHRIARLERSRRQMRARWQAILGIDPDRDVLFITQVDVNNPAIHFDAHEVPETESLPGFLHRLNLRMAAEGRAALERRRIFSDMTLLGGYKQLDGTARGYVLGVSLPLPLLHQNRAVRGQEQIATHLADVELQRYRYSIEYHIRMLEQNVQDVRAELSALTDELHSPEYLQNQLFDAYQEGLISLVDLLNGLLIYLETLEGFYGLQREFFQTLFELEAITGRQVVRFEG